MTINGQKSDDRDTRIERVLADYLHAKEAGKPLDHEALLRQHPDLADDLRSFFANHAAIVRLAAPLKDSATDETIGFEASSVAGELPRVRYFGDYELLAEIARGGMGVVHKARQVTLNRLVAVKMILAGQLASPQDLKRFYNEAEAAAQLDHPGIVPIYEVGEHEGQHFFSMGFVEGRSLAARVTNGPLPPRQAAEVLLEVAQAVQFAHDRGVIHRDLKPGNILLDQQEKPRVTDFGLAKLTNNASELTGTGQILGTPSYMPPEQASAKIEQIGPLSDVYSLGAILYCTLTGRPPFQAAHAIDTLRQVLEQEPVPVRQLNVQIPLDLETICLKCLQKEPGKRYATALALSDDLGRYLRDEPILARPIGAVARAWRWCRRKPVVAGLTISSILLITAVATVSTFAYLRESALRQLIEGKTDQVKQALLQETAAKERESQQRQEAEQHRREAEANERQANENNYATQMQLVQHAWRTPHGIAQVRSLLDGQIPGPGKSNYRGLEWYLWWRLAHAERFISPEQPGQVVGVALCPDDDTLITAAGREIQFWNLGVARPEGESLLQKDVVSGMTLSPDGKTLAVGVGVDSIALWDVLGRTQRNVLQGQKGLITAMAFAPDNDTLAVGTGGRVVTLWRLSDQTSRVLQPGHDNAIAAVTFSPKGETLAAASWDHTISIWNTTDGKRATLLRGHTGPVRALAFSPDGNQLASGGQDGTVRLWNLSQPSPNVVINTGPVSSLLFLRDGNRLIVGSEDHDIAIWDLATRKPTGTLKGHTGAVTTLAMTANGIVSGSTDRTIRQWDLDLSVQPRRLISDPVTIFKKMQFPQELTTLAITPDGATVATGYSAFHRQGPMTIPMAEAQLPIRLWDIKSGSSTSALTDPKGGISTLAYSRDGALLAAGGQDKFVQLWDTATGKTLAQWTAHKGKVNALAFAPREPILATAGDDGTIRLWQLPKGDASFVLKANYGGFGCLAFSPDGNLIAAGIASKDRLFGEMMLDRTKRAEIQVWDRRTGDICQNLSGHFGDVLALAFSSDGQSLASAGTDKVVRVWNVATGAETFAFRGHVESVTGVVFAPDDRTIISASRDRTIKFWSLAANSEVLTLDCDSRGLVAISLSADGRQLGAACERGAALVWQLAQPNEVTIEVKNRASNLVQTLFASVLIKSEVLARLRATEGFSKPILAAAASFVEELPLLSAAEINHRLRRDLSDSNRDFRPLVPAARELIRQGPDIPEYQETQGMILARSGDTEAALGALLRADRMRAIAADAWETADLADLVTAHVRAGSLERASELYSIVKQRKPVVTFTPDAKLGFVPDARAVHRVARAQQELNAALALQTSLSKPKKSDNTNKKSTPDTKE